MKSIDAYLIWMFLIFLGLLLFYFTPTRESATTVSTTKFFVSGKPELALVGPFAIFFFNLGWDILFVIVEVSKENPVLAILIFSPLLLVFITTIIEWWRGIST